MWSFDLIIQDPQDRRFVRAKSDFTAFGSPVPRLLFDSVKPATGGVFPHVPSDSKCGPVWE